MLPLETKAVLSPSAKASLLKVVDLGDFPQASLPLQRMALDVREVAPEQLSDALLRLPWGAVLTPQGFDVPDDVPHVRLDGPSALCKSGDVVELNPLQRKVAIRYRRGDTGNVLFATERCNSYCLMCSQPPREVEDDWRVHHLLDLIDLIDVAEPSLAISGGEPTLLGSGLVDIVRKCAEKLPNTHIHILSNGRLRDPELHSRFADLHPNLSWGYRSMGTITPFTITSCKAKVRSPRHYAACTHWMQRANGWKSESFWFGLPSSDWCSLPATSGETCHSSSMSHSWALSRLALPKHTRLIYGQTPLTMPTP